MIKVIGTKAHTKMKILSYGLLFLSQLFFGSSYAANERDLEAPGPKGPLKGIHTTSDNADAPVILIIPGSGPTDRNGNNPQGIKASTYKLLAEELAAHEIQSVRVDKRGLFSSSAAVDNPNQVTIQDYVDDIKSWTQTIKSKTKQSCIWLLGHSEGGLVALASAQQEESMCGIILMAAPGDKFGEILRGQLQANPANKPLLEDALQAIHDLEAGKRVDVSDFHPALQQLFFPDVQDYLINIMSFTPTELIASLDIPILILQGDTDIQVDVNDAKLLFATNPKSTLKILPHVNHVFKEVKGSTRAANIATYSDPNLPLARGVSKAIADFVKKH